MRRACEPERCRDDGDAPSVPEILSRIRAARRAAKRKAQKPATIRLAALSLWLYGHEGEARRHLYNIIITTLSPKLGAELRRVGGDAFWETHFGVDEVIDA